MAQYEGPAPLNLLKFVESSSEMAESIMEKLGENKVLLGILGKTISNELRKK